MRTRAILRLLAALSVFALLAAACGDDDESTDAGADPADQVDDGMSDDDVTDDDMTHDGSDPDHDDHDDDMADGDMTDGDMTDGDMTDGDMAGGHDHGVVDVASDVAPEVDLEVFADPAGGVNIHVISDNFEVTPRAASTDHVDGQGHYHLLIDGEKVLRFYNDWIYYAGVVEGDVEITVVVSANDHRSYAIGGEEITASLTFTVPAHEHDDHSHDEVSGVEIVGDAPTIGVEVLEDPKSGWNAFVSLDGLTLSPENVSTEHVDGEGHLHIYANGQKLGRLYDLATHIGALPEGDVEISVVAYTNDHNPYLVDGAPVSAAVTVTVAP